MSVTNDSTTKAGASSNDTSVTEAPKSGQAQPSDDVASNNPTGVAQGDEGVTMRGRSVFAIETTGAGVMVRTAWLGEDNRLLEMPAVFPELTYALNVVDDLRQQLIQHFSQAAQVGAQVIAQQMQQQQQQQQTTTADPVLQDKPEPKAVTSVSTSAQAAKV